MGIKISSASVPFLNLVDRFVPKGYKDMRDPPFAELLPRMMEVAGPDSITVNYPGDFCDAGLPKGLLGHYGVKISPVDTGIYRGCKWVLGSFANNETRREATELTKGAMDAAVKLGVSEITVWPGQDWFEYLTPGRDRSGVRLLCGWHWRVHRAPAGWPVLGALAALSTQRPQRYSCMKRSVCRMSPPRWTCDIPSTPS